MRITVNLASRPFVELRPFFLRLRIAMAVLVVTALGLAIVTHFQQKRLDSAKAQMNVLVEQTLRAQAEKTSNERRMKQPQNAAVLNRSRFLNELFLRKSFSWTAVMMDLETVMPAGVMVTSIEPQPQVTDNSVSIHMRVAGDRDKAVQLVRNLERSKRFRKPELKGEALQAKEGQSQQQAANAPPGGVEFEILATYNPISEDEAKEETARPETKTAAPKATVAPHPQHVRIPPPPPGKYPANGVVLKPYQPKPQGAKQ